METGLRQGYLGTVRRKGRIGHAKPTATAPHLYSTGQVFETANEGIMLTDAQNRICLLYTSDAADE